MKDKLIRKLSLWTNELKPSCETEHAQKMLKVHFVYETEFCASMYTDRQDRPTPDRQLLRVEDYQTRYPCDYFF